MKGADVMTAGIPSTTSGYMDDALGLDGYASVVDYLLENTPQLQHPQSVETYARMRHDPQLSAILQAYGRAVERASWVIDGAGCRDEVTQRIADDLGLAIAGVDSEPSGARRRRFTFDEHLRLAGLERVYGHMFFEQQWVEADGGWRLDTVQERMPQTVAAVHLNGDGTLKSVEQHGAIGKKAPKITTADHRLVYYVREREGSNYFGQSLLRDSYGPWLIKDQMLRVHAETIRRFGMGIPEVQAPQGATPQQLAEATRLAQTIRAGSRAGAGVPFGYSVNWKGLQGSIPDALAFITYLDRSMTRSTLTSILDMAAAEKGNRSLGETVMDLMVLAQQADAKAKADTATRQIVIPLVDANWGEDEPAPRIVAGDVGADVQLTAQDLNWLLEYGGIRPDTPARAWIRQRWGLPDEDPTDPIFAVPDPAAPADPTAPTGGPDA